MSDKNFEKINNKFRIGIEQCTPVPNFRWRTLVLGTKFAKEATSGGILGQTQPDNNLL